MANNLKALRKKHGLTQPALAQLMGTTKDQLIKLEQGTRRLTEDWIRRAANALGEPLGAFVDEFDAHISSDALAADESPLNPDEPMTTNEHTGRRGIPKDATAQLDVTLGLGAGGMLITSEGIPGKSGMTFAGEHIRDYWRLPPEILLGMGLRANDIVVMPTQGDSMLPTLSEGDFVFVDTRHRLPSPPGLYAISDEFGGMIVKRLEVVERTEDDVRVLVISDNAERHGPKERLLSEIYIIGRVIRRFSIVR